MDGLWTEWERAAVESKLDEAIIGSNATVKAGLENSCERPEHPS
jgi:hypothetical protein